jgi:Cu(I)/Ag(I) efflux system membrane fusion protein
MHPEVVKDGPGKCDVCGMDLVPAEQLGYAVPKKAPDLPLLIPATAPLITGKRAVVYVQLPDRDQPTFEGREIALGPRAGDSYIVRYGLKKNDRVVTEGNFKIDSALQIRAKPSMMLPDGGAAAADHPPDDSKEKVKVTDRFRAALTPLYKAYLHAVQLLSQDDLQAAKDAMQLLAERAKQVDAGSLDRKPTDLWRQQKRRLILAAFEASEADSRDSIQRPLAELSQTVVRMLNTFGQALDGPLYRFRCAMALKAKGGEWVQRDKKVRNPYYGPAMLGCGNLLATYPSQAPLEAPDAFREQLAHVYDAYLRLQAALADDRLDEARERFSDLRQSIATIDTISLPEKTAQAWSAYLNQMKPVFTNSPAAADLSRLREWFKPISNAMLGIVKDFGHTRKETLHKVFCPMAFDNKGAAWLQAGDTIANPYFGHQMLRCGSIRQSFPPVNVKDGHTQRKEARHDR